MILGDNHGSEGVSEAGVDTAEAGEKGKRKVQVTVQVTGSPAQQ